MKGLRKSVAYVEPDNYLEVRVYWLVAGEALAGLIREVFKGRDELRVIIAREGRVEAHGFTALSSGSA